MDEFTHLHLHTHFSFLDGIIRPEKIAQKCKKFGMPACGITDHGNVSGHIDFYKAMKKEGVIPLLGVEAYFTPDRLTKDPENKYYHLVLFAQNLTGLHNIYKALYWANKDGFYSKPRIDRKLLEEYNEGIVVLQACIQGQLAQSVLTGGSTNTLTEWWKKTFPDRFFLEIQKNGLADQDTVNSTFLKLANQFNLPVVATCDAHYLNKEDAEFQASHEATSKKRTLNQILNEGCTANLGSCYAKTPEEMYSSFTKPEELQAVRNTQLVVDLCKNINLEFGKKFFPILPNKTEPTEVLFEKEVKFGALKVLKEEYNWELQDIPQEYKDRLNKEISVILKLGFPEYFLVLQDVFRWCKEQGIRVGPARGSSSGSLVAFSLGITKVDPIRWGLLFERFLNEARVSPPDIDSDIAQEDRDRVIDYLINKYGDDRVARIANFGSYKAKSVINDLCKTLELGFEKSAAVKKLIPDERRGGQGDHAVTIEKLAKTPQIQEIIRSDIEIAKLFRHAEALDRLYRHPGVHACGVVIAPEPITNFLPIMRATRADSAGKDFVPITQFDEHGVEDCGLIKFDFLGLKTLSVIDEVLRVLKKRWGVDIDTNRFPLDDPEVYNLIAEGRTLGIFQFKESGITEYASKLFKAVKSIKGDEAYKEIVQLISLTIAIYRPGPMDNGWHEDLLQTVNAGAIHKHEIPQIQHILDPTYGFMTYQEQVIKIVQVAAGYTLAEADLVRKALAKKLPEEMVKHRQGIIDGCLKNGISEEAATRLFDSIAKWADYGFALGHSTAYALISYQTAWLKAHYPVEFIAANMTIDSDDTEEIALWIQECYKEHIKILPPDIQKSDMNFFLSDDTTIRFGLKAIKKLRKSVVESILMYRDPELSIQKQILKIKGIDAGSFAALIDAGAFDSYKYSREALRKATSDLLAGRKESNQLSLFGSQKEDRVILDVPSDKYKDLQLEQAALGLFVSDHPLKPYASDERAYTPVKFVADKVQVYGVLKSIESKLSKKGNRYLVGEIVTLSKTLEFRIFGRAVDGCSDLLNDKVGSLLNIIGEIKEDQNDIIVRTIQKLEQKVVSGITLDIKRLGDIIDEIDPQGNVRLCLNLPTGKILMVENILKRDRLALLPLKEDQFLY